MDKAKIAGQMRAEGLVVTEWSDPPGAYYDMHIHAHHEARVVLTGDITFVVGSVETTVRAGERIDFASGVAHSARVGLEGATYLAGTELA